MSTNSVVVALKDLKPSQTNPRKASDEKDLKDLATSITAHGIINPLTVRKIKGNGHFEIVAGHRRYQAAKLAGLKEVPVIVHNFTDEETLEVQIVENLQREDVHPLDEAEGFKLIARTKGIPYIAEKVGKSRRYVAERIALCELAGEFKKMLRDEKISLAVALVLVRVSQAAQKDILTGQGKWRLRSADELWDYIKSAYFNDLALAPFDTAKDALVEKVGPCTSCTSRSKMHSDLFGASLKGDMCLKPECFQEKLSAFLTARQAQLKEQAVKFVRISEHYSTEVKGALRQGSDGWHSPSRTCTARVKGLIVEGKSLDRIGKLVDVCTDPQCKRCFGEQVKASFQGDQKERTKRLAEMKKRASEKRIRQTMFKCIWEARALAKTTVLERTMILIQAAIERLSHDQARNFCNAMGISPKDLVKAGVIKEADYRKSISVWMSEFENDDMYNVAMLLGLADSLYLSGFSDGNDRPLVKIAERYGITKQTARTQIEEEDRKRAEAREVERAAKKKS